MFAIIGLGNPGSRYLQTRHNVGFWVVDGFAESVNADSWRQFGGCEIVQVKVNNSAVLLIKPQEFMNLSGQAAQRVLSFYKVKTPEIVVVHDDLDIEPGQIRIVTEGKSGGHRGVENIQSVLNSSALVRIRVGIGHPREVVKVADYEVTDWVLGKPGGDELALIKEGTQAAVEAIGMIIIDGIVAAQNQFNRRKKPEI